jgi:sigma-54 specific flagellar transcriptional regulator A
VCIAQLPARYRPSGWAAPPEPLEATTYTQTSDNYITDDVVATILESGTTPDAVAAVPADGGQRTAVVSAVAELPAEGMDLKLYLDELERALICKALEAANGTVAHAARLLGLRRTTLVEKLRKFGIASGELAATGT